MRTSKLTLGVEEEYLLVDRETREAAANPPPEFFAVPNRNCHTSSPKP